jgi:hypothetical protein
MMTDAATIRSAILHPVQQMRCASLTYFTESYTADATLMPLVIEAVEKYELSENRWLLRLAAGLPQTPETIAWVVGELSKEWDRSDPAVDDYCGLLGLILYDADPALLEMSYVELPSFPEELLTLWAEQQMLSVWDGRQVWLTLEALREHWQSEGWLDPVKAEMASRLVARIARDEYASEISRATLIEAVDDVQDPYAIQLLGRLRVASAVPSIVDVIAAGEDSEAIDAGVEALRRIGGDEVVRALAARRDAGRQEPRQSCEADLDWDYGYCNHMTAVLAGIHTPLSIETLLELHAETRRDARLAAAKETAHALLANFAPAAIDVSRDLIAAYADEEWSDLRAHLVATSTVMGASFPEYEAWYREAADNNWGWAEGPRVLDRFIQASDGDPDDDPDDDFPFEFDLDGEPWEDDYQDPHTWLNAERTSRDKAAADDAYRIEPFQRETPTIGRNDRCPCGSGKKYKKCCLGKAKSKDEREV